MVFSQYANLRIDCWLHKGKLGITEPTLCLSHDSKNRGTPILAALEELHNGKYPAQLTLTFQQSQRPTAFSRLQLKYVSDRDDLRIMTIQAEADCAVIEMTTEGLDILIDAVHSWLSGAEDFGVSPSCSKLNRKVWGQLDKSSGELWFWGPHYAGP